MWVTQIAALLIIISFVFLIYEAVANAGLLGALIRIPLHLVTNLVVFGILLLILQLILKIFIAVLSFVLGVLALDIFFLILLCSDRVVYIEK